MNEVLGTSRSALTDQVYCEECRSALATKGALVVPGFFTPQAVADAVASSAPRESDAFFAGSTHNVYLTPFDSTLPDDHVFNRQVTSSKGLIADDQIAADSPLREVYNDTDVRSFLCGVLDIAEIHPYADHLSSINVHFASEGKELGWHFDNSSFAVTMLLQAPEAGGEFEYVPDVRDADSGDMAYSRVEAVLDGDETVSTLHFEPGDLVVFRGRNAMHRVTPTEGDTTRILVVFAFNHEPGVALSDSALNTFYGRTS